MMKRRFLTSCLKQAATQHTSAKKSNIYNFLTPGSAPFFENTMTYYQNARKSFNEGDFEQASMHIENAIKEARYLRSINYPIIASIKMDLFELQDNINSAKIGPKHQ